MNSERRYLKNYRPSAYEIPQVQLSFELQDEVCRVTCNFNFQQTKSEDLVLNGVGLNLKSILLNGEPLSPTQWSLGPETLTLRQLPEFGSIETLVEINPSQNTSLEGLYLSQGQFCTQCEAEGFRKITYFLDRPDVMSSYTVTISADKKRFPILLSNGDRVEAQDLENCRHSVTYRDPHRKPCYLFALFAGDLGLLKDQFVTASGRKVTLEIYSKEGTQKRCEHAMKSLKEAMRWDEERFGLEYDLDSYMIVAIDDFNAGAMENKGLNIFNSRLVLADGETATDEDFFNIEAVIGHEYFHNWTGNRVTLRDWFQLSLKEGLTVFRDQEFSGDLTHRGVQRIKDVDTLRERQFPEDASPNAHPVRPESCLSVDNFFTPTIYEKGAEVIRMMQTLVGRPGFRKGMDEYFRRHDGQAVTTEDFARAISEANGMDFGQFRLWYSQPGTPRLEVREDYDPGQKKLTLRFQQSLRLVRSVENLQAFLIPLRLELLDSEGREIPIQHPEVKKNSEGQRYVLIDREKQELSFEGLSERPHLSLLRDFSAPITLDWPASSDELSFLALKDQDPFSRREALQKLELTLLSQWIEKLRDGGSLGSQDVPSSLVEVFSKLLQDKSLDPALKALMITRPSEMRLAQGQKEIWPEGLEKALNFLGQVLMEDLEKEFLSVYEKFHGLRPQSQNSKDFGHRALKNTCLSYLTRSKFEKYKSLAFDQYEKAQNMTDRACALSLLSNFESKERTQALEDFHQRFRSNPLVLNKWFQIQSESHFAETFSVVQKLFQHPDFQMKNPNNVYSLLRSFGQNLCRFHDPSQPTYEFLLDRIAEIDSLNPQVAARVAGAFQITPLLQFESKRRIQKKISDLLKGQKISKNTQEILESVATNSISSEKSEGNTELTH